MAKIPKNLADKDMFQGYQEEETLESAFLKAEAVEDRRRRQRNQSEPKVDLSIAYLTPDIVERLGKELLALKMELYREGITAFSMKIKREGKKIILEPVEKKKQ